MKPHPRIRKTIKWGGAVVCAMILALWVVSGWWWFMVRTGNGWASGFDNGRIALLRSPLPVTWRTGVFFEGMRNPPHFLWWFDFGSHGWDWSIIIPLWAIAAPLAGITAIAWRFDTLARRRARVGLCPKCRYDRAGLAPGAVCPECGSAALSASVNP